MKVLLFKARLLLLPLLVYGSGHRTDVTAATKLPSHIFSGHLKLISPTFPGQFSSSTTRAGPFSSRSSKISQEEVALDILPAAAFADGPP